MSTQCRFCGEAVRPDSMFCPACGQLIGAVGTAVPPFGGSKPAPAADAPAVPVPAPTPVTPVPLPAPHPASSKRKQRKSPRAQAAAVTTEGSAASDQQRPAAPSAIVLPTGDRLDLGQVLVFGRSPQHGAAEYGGLAVPLNDPERAMSRVHLVLAPSAGGASATDPGSANGTLLERAGTQYGLVAGTPLDLLPGDRLLLGDVVLTVA